MNTNWEEAVSNTNRMVPGMLDALVAENAGIAERDRLTVASRTWKTAGTPRLIAPNDLGGLGRSCRDACDVQFAIGMVTPGLAAGTTMHHLSIASVLSYVRHASQDERAMLASIISTNSVFASGFSEGNPNGSVFEPSVKATKVGPSEYLISGRKAPCSLSDSMDFIMCSVRLEDGRRAVALIPNGTPGLSVEPFWRLPFMDSSESNSVYLRDVRCNEDLLIVDSIDGINLEDERVGYQWFGVLILSGYLGALASLVRTVVASTNLRDASPVVHAVGVVDGYRRMLLSFADEIDRGLPVSVARSVELFCIRRAFDNALEPMVAQLVRSAGGFALMQNPDINYLWQAVNMHRFHPPGMKDYADKLIATF